MRSIRQYIPAIASLHVHNITNGTPVETYTFQVWLLNHMHPVSSIRFIILHSWATINSFLGPSQPGRCKLHSQWPLSWPFGAGTFPSWNSVDAGFHGNIPAQNNLKSTLKNMKMFMPCTIKLPKSLIYKVQVCLKYNNCADHHIFWFTHFIVSTVVALDIKNISDVFWEWMETVLGELTKQHQACHLPRSMEAPRPHEDHRAHCPRVFGKLQHQLQFVDPVSWPEGSRIAFVQLSMYLENSTKS